MLALLLGGSGDSPRLLDEARQSYREAGVDGRVDAFIQDMAAAYAWADLVVCRSGASTLAELCAVGVGSVLVPFAAAVDDHQTRNAEYLVERDAAVLLKQDEALATTLAATLRDLAGDPARRLAMAQAARTLAKTDAADRIADIWSVQCICLMGDCSMVKTIGCPVSAESRCIQPNSSHSGNKSDVNSNTPCPARAIARPSASSSGSVAVVPGTSSPSIDLCKTVRDVETPSAPARTPSSTNRPISAISSAVGSSLSAPRSPIT